MRSTWVVMFVLVAPLALLPAAGAFHLYRGPGGGCTPAVGNLGDAIPAAGPTTTVLMLHNAFIDLATPSPVTVIHVGDTVTWTWNSEHCHSVRAQDFSFYSGFHYPEPTPTTPELLPNLVDYPVPTLAPTLSYTHTFTAAGTFLYDCEHHNVIGMQGVVVVQ